MFDKHSNSFLADPLHIILHTQDLATDFFKSDILLNNVCLAGRQSDILVQYLHLGLLLIFCRPEAVTCNSSHSCFMYSIYPSIIIVIETAWVH